MVTSLEEIQQSKKALDSLIKKSRVHLYKPIQIAEILYHHRTDKSASIDLLELETYRKRSKHWRDVICLQFLGRVSTSSAKFQDNLFEDNAIPPTVLNILGQENKRLGGVVEAYIYQKFEDKHLQLNNALTYCLNASPDDFFLADFITQFWQQAGLKRSLDKIFEIVIYALFQTLTEALEVKIDIYYSDDKKDLLTEFDDFAKKVLNLTQQNNKKTLHASFHRVGVTNAADRGLDIYANFGSIVQVKHLTLDEKMAKSIVSSVSSKRVIIVCKAAEESIITSLLSQIGWQSNIQAVVTIDDIINWYEKALRGDYATDLGQRLLDELALEIKNEFPSVGNQDFKQFKQDRGYHLLHDDFWC